MKAGDIIGWSGRNLASSVINFFTWGMPLVGISHVGIMADYEGRLLHFEATTLNSLPCVIQGVCVKGMQAVDLTERLQTYEGRAYHYPLVRPLYEHESQRLTAWLLDRLGKPYDKKEALESGGLLGLLTGAAYFARRLRFRSKHSDAEYFCSETDSGALSHIGLAHTDDPAKWNPNKLTRSLRRRELVLPPVRLK